MAQQLALVLAEPLGAPPAAPVPQARLRPVRVDRSALQAALALPEPPEALLRATVAQGPQVRLRCIHDGRKLRVRIVEAPFPFDAALNCRFPSEGRALHREWLVPAGAIRTGRRHYLTGSPRRIVESTAGGYASPGAAASQCQMPPEPSSLVR